MNVRKKSFKYVVRIALTVIVMNVILAVMQPEPVSAELRTKTITKYWTSDWVNSTGDVNEPSTISGRYYDSDSGQYVDYTARKSGGLYDVDQKVDWTYYTSYGRASNYDKDNNNYLGFMSNNSSYYYAGRWSDSMPGEAPDRYYGDPFVLGLYDWQLVDYGWDESRVVNADSWASKGSSYRNKLVYSNGSYWWRSESGNLNKYRRGVWIKYQVKINLFKYRQKYTTTITLPDDDPPVHIADSLWSEMYQNGNDYWTQPNDTVYIRLKQRDRESGNKYQYLRLDGSGVDVRSQHKFYEGTSYNNDFMKNPNVSIHAANRTENTQYGAVNWTVTPKTHGQSYNILYYYRDNANNSVGYNDTGMNLRVDGVAPTHRTPTIYNARYIDGNTYWVRPGDYFDVMLVSYEKMSGHDRTYLRLYGDGNDNRVYHDWDNSEGALNEFNSGEYTNIISGYSPYYGWTAQYRYKVQARNNSHGRKFNVQGYYRDNVGNNRGYINTGYYIGVDGKAPDHIAGNIYGARYIDGNDYWVRSDDNVQIRLRQRDYNSGNERQYLRLYGSGVDQRAVHDFDQSSSYFYELNGYSSSRINVSSVNRTENTAYGNVSWNITPLTHGDTYDVQYYYRDNVSNNSGYKSTGKRVRVDDIAPNVLYKNKEDTSDFISRPWSSSDIEVRLKFNDPYSGYKRSRYAWTKSPNTPSASQWSNWTNNANYVVIKKQSGKWYLHTQMQDNVGNTRTVVNGEYQLNTPPIASFKFDKSRYYIGDNINVTSLASDPDGQSITHRYEITKPDGSKVTFTTPNFTYVPDIPGNYTFKQTVTDTIGDSATASTSIYVYNLTIVGNVLHTPEWESKHSALGHNPLDFYSGERFLLEADVVDYPIDYLTVDFEGYQNNGNLYKKTVKLTDSSPILRKGELYDPSFIEGGTSLKNGPATFVFEVKYTNGVIRRDTITISILGDVFEIFRLHQTK
ncbi:PKD domain-containing protein [Aquibacillus sp. 3ASR75-11]|uniref:PKD domain-containing protein n=1 Tax=Terrihalobacillus insolitus TaxID=2950438 RepID=A0A9X4AM01_9BACI|nr:hypothetical protein [Terrihalobacillus insolitus]MDC3424314.1 PKD domain-containing protein [Terrihalobacillus insolitus]